MIRGVILTGGRGARLGELTKVTNKHLLPVGKYPMIYHSIHKLVEADVRDILIVSGTEHTGDFIELLGSGASLGCDLTYKVQDEAGGIAQALGLARDFCKGYKCLTILGDNIFEDSLYLDASDEALISLKEVPDANRYGVASFKDGKLVKVVEKPKNPPSNLAVTGIYLYPEDVFDVISGLKRSSRGEYEITDVNNYYIQNSRMRWRILDGYWTDAGTLNSLFYANQLVCGTL